MISMTNKELQEELKKLPPDAIVIVEASDYIADITGVRFLSDDIILDITH